MTEPTKQNKVPNPDFINRGLIEKLNEDFQNTGGLSHAFNVQQKISGWSPITSTYISDNGGYADVATAEITAKLANIHKVITTLSEETPPQIIYHDIPSQDWRAGAFDLAQLARTSEPGVGNTFFINCAPRLAQRGNEGNNKGEEVYVGMLKSGAVISGVSPHSFAFVRDLVEEDELEIFQVNVQTDGSQFRSRDFFPWYSEILAYNLAQSSQDWKGGLNVDERRAFIEQFNFIDTKNSLTLEDIPDLAENPVVARVDTHGNLKLSITMDHIDPEQINQPMNVTINGKTFTAEIRESMFDNDSEHVGIAPGSSGNFKDSSADDSRFLEMALMGKSLFKHLELTDQDLKEGVNVEITPQNALKLNHHIEGNEM